MNRTITQALPILAALLMGACAPEKSLTPQDNRVANNTRPLSAPAKGARFATLIQTIARQENVDPRLIDAVIRQESNYDPSAQSSAGAVGLMQLMPETARDYGLAPHERYEPAKNVRAGARHLRRLLNLFNNDLRLTLAAYNAGQGTVARYGYTVPPFQETQTYVKRVTGYYRAHQRSGRFAARQQLGRLPVRTLAMMPNNKGRLDGS